jgi:hypothetical protein
MDAEHREAVERDTHHAMTCGMDRQGKAPMEANESACHRVIVWFACATAINRTDLHSSTTTPEAGAVTFFVKLDAVCPVPELPLFDFLPFALTRADESSVDSTRCNFMSARPTHTTPT